jgi:hypothetical protein
MSPRKLMSCKKSLKKEKNCLKESIFELFKISIHLVYDSFALF